MKHLNELDKEQNINSNINSNGNSNNSNNNNATGISILFNGVIEDDVDDGLCLSINSVDSKQSGMGGVSGASAASAPAGVCIVSVVSSNGGDNGGNAGNSGNSDGACSNPNTDEFFLEKGGGENIHFGERRIEIQSRRRKISFEL